MIKAGPIESQRYQAKIDRSKEIISEIWVKQSENNQIIKSVWFGSSVYPPKTKQSEVLLVMATKVMPDELKHLIKTHLEHGGRTYILTSANFDPAIELRLLTDQEKSHVLIRQLPHSPNPGYYHTDGGIWYTPLGDRTLRLHLRLTKEQSEEWRHIFLRSFWHEAEKEYYFEKGKWTSPETCWNRPTDILPREINFWKKSPDEQEARKRVSQTEIVHSLQLSKPGSLILHTKTDFNNVDLLNTVADQGVKIYGLSVQLPECHLDNLEGWLILSEKDSLVLKLSTEQILEARTLLTKSQSENYLRNRDLNSLSNNFSNAKFLLPEAKEWEPIIELWPIDKAKDIGQTTARNLQDIWRSELRWTTNDPKLKTPKLALTAIFSWEVTPPISNTQTLDSIYEKWVQNTQNCQKLMEKLKTISQEFRDLYKDLHDELEDFFPDFKALKLALGKLTELDEKKPAMEPTPIIRQNLINLLKDWHTESNVTRALLNHALLIDDWLKERTKLLTRIKEIKTKPEEEQKEINRLESQLAEKFKIAPSNKSEHRDLKSVRNLENFSIDNPPSETTPVVGKLYASKNSRGEVIRFLCISDWSDYDKGLEEAKRLGAELVTE
jgi:hypothetical protein